ncbi:MAG: NAD-dependent epimerase [Bacteroidales bacterium]|jgi:UDP-glucuronate 4-epimerase|nr:NAD-dependent epimerase [Bacteroidales bacterium]
MSKILITGTAGFIGFHLVNKLVAEGHTVTGLDNINDYYDVKLKYDRLAETGIQKEAIAYNKLTQSIKHPGYSFTRLDLEDSEALSALFGSSGFDYVVNLAAQAGVRYSIENPSVYINSNIVGFANILEACRHNKVKHLVYASSSSVYGLNEKMPFSADDNVDHPISLYAASKKSNELMAHTYSHLFDLPTTGLRFFTVYGPWGRPDMALYIFTKAITEGRKIQINNNGDMKRDFTYVSDIVNSLSRLIPAVPAGNTEWTGKEPQPSSSPAKYRIYNIGNNAPVHLMDFVDAIEQELGMEASKEFLPMQAGDVPATWADVSSLIETINYKPSTSVREGIRNFVRWYKEYVKIN